MPHNGGESKSYCARSGVPNRCRDASRSQRRGASVTSAVTRHLQSLVVKSITSDNGREFGGHWQIGQSLKADFHFAHPYHARERDVNENSNGVVRQDFPRKSDFSKITDRQLGKVVIRLNHRPGKTLGYKTPNEVFFKLPLVALTT
ncbi:MAG: IS30 family transposase [Acidobacteria bacterium]|nr:IS30 family transposase [Acidobacteriota bacterium]